MSDIFLSSNHGDEFAFEQQLQGSTPTTHSNIEVPIPPSGKEADLSDPLLSGILSAIVVLVVYGTWASKRRK